jgi:tRNA dimethylallyltransferase
MARLTTIPSLVLVGPTASGKSDIAHLVARRLNLGIISADAMMVYRGMSIGTAKPTPEERGAIPYLGLDLTTHDQSFSVFDYLRAMEQGMSGAEPGAAWMVAGGTGLYVRALVQGLDDDPGEDLVVRREAEMVLSDGGFEALKTWCCDRQPDLPAQLPPGDLANPRRWIRAVERGISRPDGAPVHAPLTCVVGLRREKMDLEARIRRRVDLMYASGFLDEVRTLRRANPVFSPTASMAIGYAEAMAVLDGKTTQREAMEQTVIRTRQYAKRQMTWFRHQVPTRWIDVHATDDVATLADRVIECMQHHD